jgi:hypothetical protein
MMRKGFRASAQGIEEEERRSQAAGPRLGVPVTELLQ